MAKVTDFGSASAGRRAPPPGDTRRVIAFGIVAALGAVGTALGIVAMMRPGVVLPLIGNAALWAGLAAFVGGLLAALSIRAVAIVATFVEVSAAAKIKAGRPAPQTTLSPAVVRFVPWVVAALVVLPIFGLGAVITSCTFTGSADARAFIEQRFAVVRRRPRAFLDGARGDDEKAAYQAIAASTDQRLDPFAGASGYGDSPFRLEHAQSCIQGELVFRDGASRDLAMFVVGDRHGERMQFRFDAIALDRRCSCSSHEKHGPEICTLK